jgi:hypothetical protein
MIGESMLGRICAATMRAPPRLEPLAGRKTHPHAPSGETCRAKHRDEFYDGTPRRAHCILK